MCPFQFTMEMERDSNLPFLDIDIYRRPSGSLGHKVCRKHTHTNLCLNCSSHHLPLNKHAILSTLVHRARVLCDQDSLHVELVFMGDIFRQNSYTNWQIHKTLKPPSEGCPAWWKARFSGFSALCWVDIHLHMTYGFPARSCRSVHTALIRAQNMASLGTHQPPPLCPGFLPLPQRPPHACDSLIWPLSPLHVGSLPKTPLHFFLVFILDQ
jgi:hypothetical protein